MTDASTASSISSAIGRAGVQQIVSAHRLTIYVDNFVQKFWVASRKRGFMRIGDRTMTKKAGKSPMKSRACTEKSASGVRRDSFDADASCCGVMKCASSDADRMDADV
jgi:hypothetical protein